MLTYPSRKLLQGSRASLNSSQSRNEILLLVLVITLTFHPILAPQGTESHSKPSWTFDSIPVQDFRVGATLPNTVPADGTTPATSTIFVSPMKGFNGTVALSDLPLPTGLFCTAIVPATIPNGSGTATISCVSRVAGTYRVAIIGASGEIRHDATATFTFAAFTFPDFTIAATSLVNMISATIATSNVTVIPQGGYDSEVNLTAIVYPSTGLSVFLTPQRLILGSGTATASFNASVPGDYNVTITGMSKSLSHTVTMVVRVTLAGMPVLPSMDLRAWLD